jgi:transposase
LYNILSPTLLIKARAATDAETFEEWLKDMLLALDKPSLIILDNASYHSRLHEKHPTTAWRKSELQNWLRENNILYSDLDTKNSLLQICRANYREKVCEVDCIIREAGHEVLRLPPYHCMFNPIEMVWSQSERLYDKEVLKPNVDVVSAWNIAPNSVTKEQWSNYFRHTIIGQWNSTLLPILLVEL